MKEPGTRGPEVPGAARQGERFGFRLRDAVASLEIALLGGLLAVVLFGADFDGASGSWASRPETLVLWALVVLARVLAVPLGGRARFLLPLGELWILTALFALEPLDVLLVAGLGECVGQLAVGVRRRFLDGDRREFFPRDEASLALLALGETLATWSAVLLVHQIVGTLLNLPPALHALTLVLAVVATATITAALLRQLFQRLRGLEAPGSTFTIVDAKTFGLRLVFAPLAAFLAQRIAAGESLAFAFGATVLALANLIAFLVARTAALDREKRRLLQVLRGAASAVHVAASFDRMLERFCEDARRAVPSLSMFVALVKPGRDAHDVVFFDDGGGQRLDVLGPQRSELVGELLARREPWSLPALDPAARVVFGDPVLARLERRPRSLLGVRLDVREEPIGVAVFWSYRAFAFRDTIARTLATLVDFVGTAISNLRMMERLQQAEGRYRALFEHAGDGIAILDPDGVVLESNARFREIVKVFADRVSGRPFRDLFPPDQRARVERLRRRSHDEHIVGEGFLLRGPGGESFELAMGMGALMLDEGPRTLVHVRDRSESARLERQLADIHRMASVGKLASGIAHDLNNLLGVILGHTYRLTERPDDATAVSVRAIRQSAMEGATMTKRLLQYGRGTTLERVPVVLDEFLRSSLPLLRGALPANVELEFVSEVRDLLIPVDPGQMQQVLLNLVLNAAHAMPDGGRILVRLLLLHGERAPDDVEGAVLAVVDDPFHGDWARIEVVDQGVGIDPRYRDKVFEPFFSTRDREHGHGLGLFVSQVIVQAHRGRITFESLAGLGTTFRVDVPIEPEVEVLPTPPVRAEETPRTRMVLFQATVDTGDRLEGVLRTQGYGLDRVLTLDALRTRLRARQQLPVFVDSTYGGIEMMHDLRQEFPRTDFVWIVDREDQVASAPGEVLLERKLLHRVEFDLLFRALRVSRVPG